jgi:hypothetical protein
MRLFWLALSFSGLVAACGGTSTDGLFDQGGAGGRNPGSGGAAGNAGLGGASGVLGAGGSSGVTSSGGSSGVTGSGGASGGTGSAGSSGDAGSSGTAGVQGVGGSAGATGSNGVGGVFGSGGSSGSLGSAGSGTGATDGGVIDPVDASPDGSEDASPPCPTGNYSGSLSGPYRSRLGNSTFTARVEFAINSDGGVLGKITATSNPTGRANFAGKLDCRNGKLALQITDGSYSDAIGVNRYTGTMNATYEPGTQSFPNGTFTVTETNPMYGGQGSWNASLASG